ncbi:hypothetical protein EJ03DRAFT_6832 [Teratosphaeria nubilosa]|uniref:Uncharacterized protein n=1 Tax=Teratosphaeria nubilosa TaxID=161662 RepID=A0A6G1LQL6_9PEZI|nr:hypothetical protein EJ03DRAFT_6832 [Teratosphaeria nubilosa]
MVLSSVWRSVFDALDDIADELLPLLSPASITDDRATATERDELESQHGDGTRPESASIGVDEDTLDYLIINWEDKSIPGEDDSADPGVRDLEFESDDREEPDVYEVSDGLGVEQTGSASSFTSKGSAVTRPALAVPEVDVENAVTRGANQDHSDPACNIDEPDANLEYIEGSVGTKTWLVKPSHMLVDSCHAAGHEISIIPKDDHLEEVTFAGDPRDNIGPSIETNRTSDDWFRSSDDWDFTAPEHLRPEATTDDIQNCNRPTGSVADYDNHGANSDDLAIDGDTPRASQSDSEPDQTQNTLGGEHDKPRFVDTLADAKENVSPSGVEQNEAEAGNRSLPLSSHGNLTSAEDTRQSERSEGEPNMLLNDIDRVIVANSASSPATPATPLADTSKLDIELLSPRSTTSRHSSASFGSSLSRKSDKWSASEPAQPVVSISTHNASASAPSSGSKTGSAHDALRMGVPKTGSRARYRSVLSRRAKSPVKKLKLRGGDADGKRNGRTREISGTWNTSFGIVDNAMLM